jgi:hypothetical protein
MHTQRDNYSLGCASLAAGTGAGTIKTQAILHYALGGRTYVKAVTDNIALALQTQVPALTNTAMAASQVSVYFLFLDSAGAVSFKQSAIKSGTTAASYTPGAFEWPADDGLFTCFGAMKIATNASGVFTAGTTALNATGVTPTFYNVGDDYGVPIPY